MTTTVEKANLWRSRVLGGLERATVLDPAVDAVTGLVDKVLPPGQLKDVLHGKWLGHPLHPLLVALPIGMFSSASLLDVIGGKDSQRAARRLVGYGVLLLVPTAAAGYADWSELGDFHRPRRVGLVHAEVNAVTGLLYAASWVARVRGDQARGRNLAFAGALGLSVGGYLGAHLAYVEGVGVNRNADSPTSPQEWTDVAAVSDVGEGVMRRIEVDGQPVLLTRRGGEVFALGATCSHYGGPLDEGYLEGGAQACVVCPWHGSRFRLSDGGVARGPATVPQPPFSVRTVEGRLQLKARA